MGAKGVARMGARMGAKGVQDVRYKIGTRCEIVHETKQKQRCKAKQGDIVTAGALTFHATSATLRSTNASRVLLALSTSALLPNATKNGMGEPLSIGQAKVHASSD